MKKTKINPFDIIESLSSTKKNLFKEHEDPDLLKKEYNLYFTNTAFSLHQDTIMLANQMNLYGKMPKEQNYDFYLYGVRAKKRYSGKWPKTEKIEEIEYLSKFYQINRKKAKELLPLLSKEQLAEIRNRILESEKQNE